MTVAQSDRLSVRFVSCPADQLLLVGHGVLTAECKLLDMRGDLNDGCISR